MSSTLYCGFQSLITGLHGTCCLQVINWGCGGGLVRDHVLSDGPCGMNSTTTVLPLKAKWLLHFSQGDYTHNVTTGAVLIPHHPANKCHSPTNTALVFGACQAR
jgi:hypothetical protein